MSETNYCSSCGAQLPDMASFCSKCGIPVEQIISQTPPPYIPPPPPPQVIYQPIVQNPIPVSYNTTVCFYNSEGAMKRGIKAMEKQGWEVMSTEISDQGYGCLKTGCLGLLFLPLALLGKKRARHKVTYRKPK